MTAPYEVVQKRGSFAGNLFEQIARDISIRHSARVECLLVDIENPGAYLLCYSAPGVQRLDSHSRCLAQTCYGVVKPSPGSCSSYHHRPADWDLWRQSESCKLAVLSKDLAGMEPFATFGTAVDPIPIGNPVLPITPVVPAS